jgi:zinc transporter ZupT
VEPFTAGFLASLAAALATGVGALPALLVKKASDRLLDAMMGFATAPGERAGFFNSLGIRTL